MKVFVEVKGEGIKKDTPVEVKASALKSALIDGKPEETLCIREGWFEVSRFLILDATENTLVDENAMTFEELAMFALISITSEADRISKENDKLILLRDIATRIMRVAENEPDVDGFKCGCESHFAYYISENAFKKHFGPTVDLTICANLFDRCLFSTYSGVRYFLFDLASMKQQIKSDEFDNIEDSLNKIMQAECQLEYIIKSMQAGERVLMANLDTWKNEIANVMKTYLNYRVKEVTL